MPRVVSALAILALCVGCESHPIIYVPGPPPPPVEQPPPPPVDQPPPPVDQPPPPPPVDPTPIPTSILQIVAKIVVGSTLSEATAAMGSNPTVVPASQAAPATARWIVTVADAGTWMVYAVLDASNKVAASGAALVGENR